MKIVNALTKYLRRPQTSEEWFMASKLILLLVAFLIVSSAAVFTLFTRASASTIAESVKITASADASIDSSKPKSNFDDDDVKVEKTKIALLKFAVPSFSGRYITNGTLRIYINNTSHNAIEIKNASSTWDEKKVTFNTAPQIDPNVIGVIPANTPKGWYTIDLTKAVRLNTGHIWSIAITEPLGGTESMHFDSKETKNKPALLINFSTISVVPVSPYVSVTPIATPSLVASGTPVLPTKVISPFPSATKTPLLTTSPVPTAIPGQAIYPAQILNLTNWKETLPIGASEHPTEITQQQLATYMIDPWFVVTPDKGVRFRAPVNGTTTSGSNYPRSELREMTNNGSANASWSSASGIHTMIIDEAITHTPYVKPHVVAGQIHDSNDDIIVIRLENSKLFVDIAGKDGPTLDANYIPGKRFMVKFEVSNGQTRIYYKSNTDTNFILAYTLTKTYSSAYFKAGAYTQSACTTNGGQETDCSANNYGEVVIYNLSVTHQ